MNNCYVCGMTKKKLVNHYLNYQEDITIKVCPSCHRKIHQFHHKYNDLKPKDSPIGTLITIEKKTAEALKKLKITKQESYDEIIKRLLKGFKK